MSQFKPNNEGIDIINGFTSYMGAEYTFFVSKYMQRPVIYRDMNEGSLFAKYIWENFYSKEGNINLFKLTQSIQKFYHRCAYGNVGDVRKMKQFWRELKIFIDDFSLCKNEDVVVDLEKFLPILNQLES